MKFIKYNSIENLSNKLLFEFKESPLYNPSDIWVVTPKIDGSNFSIYFDENMNMIPAQRSSFISMSSDFFNFQKVFDKYQESFKSMYNIIMNDYPSINEEAIVNISFHGELCGGFYPDMPILPNVKRIQKRVHYSNDTELIIFDIRVWVGENKYYYMSHHHVVKYCNALTIPVVPVLFTGYLDQCMSWSHEHCADPDETWKIFGMPHEVPNNIREGHVIKPLKTIFKGDHRIIFKDKNEKFKENHDRGPKIERKIEYTDALMEVLEDITGYISYNRFCSVISKFGDYSIKNFPQLMNLMVEDIKEELDREGRCENLTHVDKAELHRLLVKYVSAEFVKNKKEWF